MSSGCVVSRGHIPDETGVPHVTVAALPPTFPQCASPLDSDGLCVQLPGCTSVIRGSAFPVSPKSSFLSRYTYDAKEHPSVSSSRRNVAHNVDRPNACGIFTWASHEGLARGTPPPQPREEFPLRESRKAISDMASRLRSPGRR